MIVIDYYTTTKNTFDEDWIIFLLTQYFTVQIIII